MTDLELGLLLGFFCTWILIGGIYFRLKGELRKIQDEIKITRD